MGLELDRDSASLAGVWHPADEPPDIESGASVGVIVIYQTDRMPKPWMDGGVTYMNRCNITSYDETDIPDEDDGLTWHTGFVTECEECERSYPVNGVICWAYLPAKPLLRQSTDAVTA